MLPVMRLEMVMMLMLLVVVMMVMVVMVMPLSHTFDQIFILAFLLQYTSTNLNHLAHKSEWELFNLYFPSHLSFHKSQWEDSGMGAF